MQRAESNEDDVGAVIAMFTIITIILLYIIKL